MSRLFLSLNDQSAIARRDALEAESRRLWAAGDGEAGASTFRDNLAVPTTVQVDCPRCGRAHDALWTVQRVCVDTFGHFPVFRLNGRETVIDGSLPHTVDRLPRDARPVSPIVAAGYWHDDNESHVFGGPNVAAALRSTIAAHNESVR